MQTGPTWFGSFGLFALLITLGGVSVGIVMILGALKMMRLESRGWAMTASVLALLPFGLVNPLGLAAGIWSLIVLNRRNVRLAFEAQHANQRRQPSTSAEQVRARYRKQSAVLWVLALVALVVACPLGILTLLVASWVSYTDLQVPARSNVPPIQTSPYEAPERELLTCSGGMSAAEWRGWEWSANGPEVYESLARSGLGLDDTGIEEVNKVLQASHRDYLKLEAPHRVQKRTDEGHLMTTIAPFDVTELENRLWSKLDGLLGTEEQQTIARLNLKLYPRYHYDTRIGAALAEQAQPGLFGWGADGARIEIWRVGSWFSWRINFRPSQNQQVGESGSQLPLELRRFWTEPMPEKPPAENAPAEKVPPANSGTTIE